EPPEPARLRFSQPQTRHVQELVLDSLQRFLGRTDNGLERHWTFSDETPRRAAGDAGTTATAVPRSARRLARGWSRFAVIFRRHERASTPVVFRPRIHGDACVRIPVSRPC